VALKKADFISVCRLIKQLGYFMAFISLKAELAVKILLTN
jgi:hypothetical protein